MHKTISLFAGLTALFAMGSVGAQGQPVCPDVPASAIDKLSGYTNTNPETGHLYEVYRATGITWNQARCFINGLPAVGSEDTEAHLATVTSSSENKWIVDNLLAQSVRGQFEGGRTQVWLGGFRDAAAAGGWRWINKEGPFPGVNSSTVFANWAVAEGEPNNSGGGENWVTLGRYSANLAGWNDEGAAVGSIAGFIVEYDTPRTSAECANPTPTSTVEACTTVKGQTLTFPAGSFVQETDGIKFTAFEFQDPRVDANGKCPLNRGPLVLFDDAAFGGAATLTIPQYLCGSPKFLVVKVDATDLDIFKGAVGVKNETVEILPGNKFECFDPILQSLLTDNPRYSNDPQYQDVVVWQSTDPSKMLEGPPVNGSVGAGPSSSTNLYFGTATEATNGCGSTTGKVRTGSYFVVGMHIDFGLENNLAATYTEFFKLTQYKLSLLLQSVRNARSALIIRNPDGQAMESQVRNAISAMNAGDPASALTSINQFLKKVNDSKYVTTGVDRELLKYNYNGDHLMRGENIAFTLRVKVIPFKPVP